MDKASEVVSSMNVRVLKEPRGFIRIILVILAIFAFATTCGSSGRSSFIVTCKGKGTSTTKPPQKYEYSVGYPFKLDETVIEVKTCNETDILQVKPYGNFSSASQFYVFVGVMAFLFGLASLVLYLFFDEKYRQFDLIPLADFVIAALFVFLWLISSSVWAQGVADLKYYSNPYDLIMENPVLKPFCDPEGVVCTVDSRAPYASLNVSLILGFLNMVVWFGNLWFLWKETTWFKSRSAGSNQPDGGAAPQQQVPERI